MIYGEDDWLDEHDYYKLRLTDGELHTLLTQRSFQAASWGRDVTVAVAFGEEEPFPGWNPGRSPKTRSTYVKFERKPGDKATYLDITIDPYKDGTDDVYLELGYS